MENTLTKENLSNWMPYLKEEIKMYTNMDEFQLDTVIQIEELNPELQQLTEEDLSFLKEVNLKEDELVEFYNPLVAKENTEVALISLWKRAKRKLWKWIKQIFCKVITDGEGGIYSLDDLIALIVEQLPGGKVIRILMGFIKKAIAKLIRSGYGKVCPA